MYHQSGVKICAEHHKETKALTESKEPDHGTKCTKAERLSVDITGFQFLPFALQVRNLTLTEKKDGFEKCVRMVFFVNMPWL